MKAISLFFIGLIFFLIGLFTGSQSFRTAGVVLIGMSLCTA
jgi:uncharacterized membrane protein